MSDGGEQARMDADPVLAVAPAGPATAPDWVRAEAHVRSFSGEQLAVYLDSPADFSFRDFGSGLEGVRQELLDDLARFRRAVEEGDPELARLAPAGLRLYVSAAGSDLHAVMERLRWSGTLAAAGFEDVPSV